MRNPPVASTQNCLPLAATAALHLFDLQAHRRGHAVLLYRPTEIGAMQTLVLDRNNVASALLTVPGSEQAGRDGGRLSVGNGVMLALWQREADSAVLANVFDGTAQQWLAPQQLAPASDTPPLLVRARPRTVSVP